MKVEQNKNLFGSPRLYMVTSLFQGYKDKGERSKWKLGAGAS